MENRPHLAHFKRRMLMALGLTLAVVSNLTMHAQPIEKQTSIGRLTRYAVKSAERERFQVALSEYVFQALIVESSIQAEAFYEKDDRSVMWLIERWKNRQELERFGDSPYSKRIESLKSAALKTNAEVYHVIDQEPISKEQWRRRPSATDRPIMIMLFVDSKAGTQDKFKATYHTAMPAFRGEPGVVTYQLSQFENDETKFVTYEKFRSNDAFQFHLTFPPIKPVIDYLQTSIKQPPFQAGLHTLIEFAPQTWEHQK
jgi:quinol monooxygenase YgiN